MAKRPASQSQAEDTSAAAPARPRARRARAGSVAAANNDSTARSGSMSSEPSEEDIRVRAYHRYLERGRGHGLAFEDWLEAEKELKPRR